MPLSIDKIEALAPDQASLAAAVKIKPGAWPLLAMDSGQAFAWGECQGSGSTPYRVCVEIGDLGYKCSCPSRKFPCKHSLSLMLLLAKSPKGFQAGAIPDWVGDWASRRRPGAAKKPDATEKPRASLDAALGEAPFEPRDEKAEARSAQQRERLRAQREESIRAGLDELDLWIADRLNRGLAGFMAEASQQCRVLAQRMVDAKAPGIATWIDAVPSDVLGLPERLRADAVIEVLGSLHLLAEAYRRQDKLPEPLRHDVRRLVGWTQERQALLEDATAPRTATVWTVIATHVEVQPDKLRRIETWLMGERDGAPVHAVLIDFVPVATGAGGSAFLPGEIFEGEVVYYPSAAPLRSVLARRGDTPAATPPATASLAAALDAYDGLRAAQPWLRHWPMTVSGVACRRHGADGLWLVNGEAAVPLHPRQQDDGLVLTGLALQSVTGLWDGRFFTAVMAETALGRWVRQ
ncbi:MAG: SWIM zinc finger family protein [Aestuariivirga sp.]